MLITVLVTTVVWLTVTLLTPPETRGHPGSVLPQVRPGGPGWRAVSERLGFGDDPIPGGALSWVNWVAGVAAVYCAVVSLGALLTGSLVRGAAVRGRRDRGFPVDTA